VVPDNSEDTEQPMLNDKAQVMILLKEAAAHDCLARALDVVTLHTRAGVPDWGRIREAVEAMLVSVRAPAATRVSPLQPIKRSAGG